VDTTTLTLAEVVEMLLHWVREQPNADRKRKN